jgi:hypothetical protein
MRLGKEQASGYVEDTATDSIVVEEITTGAEELTRPTLAQEPAAILQPAQPVG